MALAENNWRSSAQVVRMVRRCLAEGVSVEIDGLGTFLPDARHGFRFLPRNRPKVFVAYVQEDAAAALRVFEGLESAGFEPWLDRRRLLPGQNWPRSIEEAIDTSDFFLACFSRNSINKKGGFQAEIRYALDCTRRIPLDEIFLIPARLDACPVPARIQRELQYIDLFPDWERGFRRVVMAMRRLNAPRTDGKPASRLPGGPSSRARRNHRPPGPVREGKPPVTPGPAAASHLPTGYPGR